MNRVTNTDRCDWCNREIDTDKDTECYWEDMCACEPCRERMQLRAELLTDEASE